MQSTPTNNEQMTLHLHQVCVNLVCFIAKTIKEMCEKLTEIQYYKYKKASHIIETSDIMTLLKLICYFFWGM